ncbi:hypothetical protein Terro_2464 [Terriglobus roseus DSM 18391]|uniref:Uncharacterized protein n=1 Tax=Terriglobus roseus (strain DSM 18391 / NRRL B-41598 / KBS 63) TaxID=926566 RepID=I3ZHJ7_TERRK|nr:hypothetical protein [Terriglobus roseus]AFL88373.1 hypothetical protein Terro_2100 [Terriglobus roseus DSM 18391]AFL88715.1 hypothetical protein Terro_2464 [Terriglobus roseus DSM 18391]
MKKPGVVVSLILTLALVTALPLSAKVVDTANEAQGELAGRLKKVNEAGISVTTVSDLASSVSVEAVLLPYSVTKRTFGRELADKYAAVSLIVSNRDPRQSVILHSVFLDYSKWLFSGIFAGMTDKARVETTAWQAQTNPSQVASAEVRTVRTDFQDAQLWSARNWAIHIATAVGATAGGLAYSTASDLFSPSVTAFSSYVVPAIGAIWPDNSQTQLNLLNDIGFRTNHVIAAKSADIVVAFFPLDRFLTPSLQKIYKQAPAAFFNPAELLLEKDRKKGPGLLMKQLEELGIFEPVACVTGDKEKPSVRCAMFNSVMEYERHYAELKKKSPESKNLNPCGQPGEPPAFCYAVDMLNRVSLNTIRLVVGGVMTIDAASVPATISSVNLNAGTLADDWKASKTLTGSLMGTFLSGAALSVTSPGPGGTTTSPFSAITIDPASTDSIMTYKATVGSSDLASGAKLSFVVSKTAQDNTTTTSTPYIYTLPDPALSFDSANWAKGGKVSGSIKGTGLTGVTLLSVQGSDANQLAANFAVENDANSDTSRAFTLNIVNTDVPHGTVLTFTLSKMHADNTAVTLLYTVP